MLELLLSLLLQLSILTGTPSDNKATNTSSAATLSTTSAGSATTVGTGDNGSGETNYGGTGTWDTRD
ncbi:hypothetical protein ACFSC6_14090 [Rufibacter sediminis]|uniref:Uncharacterized protein n=1 Tax=Rufibacter sediminis TaxID=2762756 RepID=A0ABR6VYL2_9BACT|nr:hypothetical protein [Rufibacter sediminis]MBC3542322.1 hypothetical protein [Rufibacter sediminis]